MTFSNRTTSIITVLERSGRVGLGRPDSHDTPSLMRGGQGLVTQWGHGRVLKTARRRAQPELQREILAYQTVSGHPWHGLTGTARAGTHLGLEMPACVEAASEAVCTASDLWRLARDVASQLRAAHREGVLHRDVKPANVLRWGDGWILADWGLARVPGLEDWPDMVRLGTSSYIPRESADGQRLAEGPHTDAYGLGVTILRVAMSSSVRDDALLERSEALTSDLLEVRCEALRATALGVEPDFFHLEP